MSKCDDSLSAIKHATNCVYSLSEDNFENISLFPANLYSVGLFNNLFIDVLVCAVCGRKYCAECFDSLPCDKLCGVRENESLNLSNVSLNSPNQSLNLPSERLNLSNVSLNSPNCKQNTPLKLHNKCTSLFCALHNVSTNETLDITQTFCGHYSHVDEIDECFVCHEKFCVRCRWEFAGKYYCKNCIKRCLFCAKITEFCKKKSYADDPRDLMQSTLCIKCDLPCCDDCLDYDYLCPGCSGDQSG